MKKNILMLITMTLLIAACAKKPAVSASAALESILSVSKIEGSAKAVNSSGETELTTGSRLQKGDRIETSAGARVDLDLGERGVLRLGPSATFAVDKNEGNVIEGTLSKGRMISCLRKLKKGESFNLKMPVAIAGVRGTSFIADAGENRISVLTGKVALDAGGKTTEAAELTTVSAGSASAPIRGSLALAMKEMIEVTGVEKTGELEAMKANLARLEILDSKNTKESLNINQNLNAGKTSTTLKQISETAGTNKAKIKVAQKKINTDDDLMLKR